MTGLQTGVAMDVAGHTTETAQTLPSLTSRRSGRRVSVDWYAAGESLLAALETSLSSLEGTCSALEAMA